MLNIKFGRSKLKVALCAIAKNENLYINEWINYHLNLGINHIYIYDNNDSTGEKIADIVPNNKSVTIINFNDKKYSQHIAYTDCFNKNKNTYDWFLFIDIDEYLYIENHKSVQRFLEMPQFKHAEIIRLHWKHFDDNDLLDAVNNNYSVVKRFTRHVKYEKDVSGKSFIKSTVDIKDRHISAHGYCNELNYKAVDVFGQSCNNTGTYINSNISYKIAWINHYRTKTVGEYIRQKYFRGDASSKQFVDKYNNLDFFFETNKRTKEKEEYANKLIEELKNKNI